MINELFSSKPVQSLILGFILAQVIKLIHDFTTSKKISWRLIFEEGGFPSAHICGMTAVATAILIEQGLSLLFVAFVAVLIIVFRDAVGVRNRAGRLGKAVNQMAKKAKVSISEQDEQVGHTIFEAVSGLVFGFLIALVIYAL